MSMNRRDFLGSSLAALAAASLHGGLTPNFVMAQGLPATGPTKNFIHIFLRGGMDTLAAYPFTAGPLEQFLRSVRPTVYPQASSILSLSGMSQAGRQNLVGFHPAWADLIAATGQVGSGIALLTQFGVTSDYSFSHDIATAHMHNGTNRDGPQIAKGWLANLIDAGQLPFMSAWGIGATSDSRFYNARTVRPIVLESNLDSYNFIDRNFSSTLSCGRSGANPALPGCPTSGDTQVSAADDISHARSLARELAANRVAVAGSVEEAIAGSLDGMYRSAAVVNAQIRPLSIVDATFRPTNGNGHGFQSTMRDLVKVLIHSNSAQAPETLRNSQKILCTGIGGWDTHRYQSSDINYNINIVSGALKGLLLTLQQYNLLASTVVMVTSEFSRTTRENGSFGTDHASASTCMILGGGVRSAVLGPEPTLNEATANNAFFAEVAFTGVIRQILGSRMGFSNAALDAAFPDRLVNEVNLPIFQ
jgi:uncharacterized protein (DUF1501 family)